MMKSFILVFTLCFIVVSSDNENDSIQIVNSGSTNTASYVIELQRNGLVKWNVAPRFRPLLSTTTTVINSPSSTPSNLRQLPLARTNSIFQAIDNAFPLNQYLPVHCIKSISFGTSLHVTYKGQQTPDLNCPMKVQELLVLSKYIHELIADLPIQTLARINK